MFIFQTTADVYSCQIGCDNTTKIALNVRHIFENQYCYWGNLTCSLNATCELICEPIHKGPSFYLGPIFISFVLLMALGSIGYNVTNSISDAICFDVLGKFKFHNIKFSNAS